MEKDTKIVVKQTNDGRGKGIFALQVKKMGNKACVFYQFGQHHKILRAGFCQRRLLTMSDGGADLNDNLLLCSQFVRQDYKHTLLTKSFQKHPHTELL